MKKHIFVDVIVEKFANEASKTYYNGKKTIVNGDKTLLSVPLTEITQYLHEKFDNHTLLGRSDGRNFYAFDTGEGIFLVYSPIPMWSEPKLEICYVTYYENKEQLVNEFLPPLNHKEYDYDYHVKKYSHILAKIAGIGVKNDDSNTVKNVLSRIESFRKSTASFIFDKSKNKM